MVTGSSGRRRGEAEPEGDGLGPIACAELGVDVVDVVLHGLLADVQGFRYVAVAAAADDVFHDLHFSPREPVGAWRLRWQPACHRSGAEAVDDGAHRRR